MDLKTVKQSGRQGKARKRLGRGTGSGLGKTCGKGHKGQKARSGYSWHAYFEGGQMPLYRRLPKKGFNNGRFRKEFALVNVEDLNRFPAGSEVTPASIQEAGLVKNLRKGLRVLGKGELKVGIQVKAHGFSESASRKIEAAGGKAEPLASRRAKPRKKRSKA
jgi:large subunit ribosomal protein L15